MPDLRALLAEAARRRLRIAVAADTHLHADFLSGALQLAADGTQLVTWRWLRTDGPPLAEVAAHGLDTTREAEILRWSSPRRR